MLTMNLEGLEMIAVLVVVVLFVKVLEQFGLLEAGFDGKERVLSPASHPPPVVAKVLDRLVSRVRKMLLCSLKRPVFHVWNVTVLSEVFAVVIINMLLTVSFQSIVSHPAHQWRQLCGFFL